MKILTERTHKIILDDYELDRLDDCMRTLFIMLVNVSTRDNSFDVQQYAEDNIYQAQFVNEFVAIIRKALG